MEYFVSLYGRFYSNRKKGRFIWQMAKLIGLLNKQYYTSRSVTLEESIEKTIKPEGSVELATKVIRGELTDKEELYLLCDNLWLGLNNLLEDIGIEYRDDILEL